MSSRGLCGPDSAKLSRKTWRNWGGAGNLQNNSEIWAQTNGKPEWLESEKKPEKLGKRQDPTMRRLARKVPAFQWGWFEVVFFCLLVSASFALDADIFMLTCADQNQTLAFPGATGMAGLLILRSSWKASGRRANCSVAALERCDPPAS